MTDITELEKLLCCYQANRLPEEIRLVYIPMEKTAYGDYRIAETYAVPQEPTMEYELGSVEHIKIERFRFGDQDVFAGYGQETKTLVIGRDKDECL